MKLLETIKPQNCTSFSSKKKYRLNLHKRNATSPLANFLRPNVVCDKMTRCTAHGVYNRNLFDKTKAKAEVVKILRTNKYIIPTYQVANGINDINWHALIGKSFVIKPSNQCYSHGIIIQKTNLKKQNIASLKEMCANNKYLVKCKHIMIEKFIGNKNSKTLFQQDYKFWCFYGQPFCCEMQNNDKKRNNSMFYDLNWKPMTLCKTHYSKTTNTCRRPKNLQQMIEIAKKISKNMPVVRIDLYNVNGKIYFGECQKIYGNHCQFKNANDKLAYLLDLNKIPTNLANLLNSNDEVATSQQAIEAQRLLACPEENFEFTFAKGAYPIYFDNRDKSIGIFNLNNFWYQRNYLNNFKVAPKTNTKIYNKKYQRFEELKIAEAKTQLNIRNTKDLRYQYDPEGDLVYFNKMEDSVCVKYIDGEWQKEEYTTIKITKQLNEAVIKNMRLCHKTQELFQPVCDKMNAGTCTPYDITCFFQRLRQLTF